MLKSKERPMPKPAYMSEDQMAQYLSDLRKAQRARPSGSRPPPPSKFTLSKPVQTEPSNTKPLANVQPKLSARNSMPIMPTSQFSHQRTDSNSSAKNPFLGRPIARAPSAASTEQDFNAPEKRRSVSRVPSMTYMENGTRWMEKQEVKSLRQALQDMDLGEERRVHDAAQDEAAELVWKHQNPDVAYPNPEESGRKDYRSHLRKGSYQRSHPTPNPVSVTTQGRRSGSGGSHSTTSNGSTSSRTQEITVPQKVSPPSGVVSVPKTRKVSFEVYDGLAEAVANDIASAHRRTSSGSKRVLSGEKKIFMHPNDRIWEDPQEEQGTPPRKIQLVEEKGGTVQPATISLPPPQYRKNPFNRVKMQQDKIERSISAPELPKPTGLKFNRVEIQKNPPTQSRNPFYMSNEPLPPTPPSATSVNSDETPPKKPTVKDGKEIRGDDIRAATSKFRKDYSPKLPRPTVLSNRSGRPIVSFDKELKPKEAVLEEASATSNPNSANTQPHSRTSDVSASTRPVPDIRCDDTSKPPIPTINLPDEPTIPSIIFPEESMTVSSAPIIPTINVETPSININSPDESSPSRNNTPQRPSHPPTQSTTPKSTPHYSQSIRQSGALCARCALPIEGRILSAAGERFHPACFVCHQCNTNLECVAFYPEPDKQRGERLHRTHRRQTGEDIPVPDGYTARDMQNLEAHDGDETLRFYCHLDFHELFSPRCKSCKTPIEGEVVLACGAEWHVGHFFCAECGDPFDSCTPFVEKDGYAWCVNCHTRRYSSKCRRCRKPVTDVVVKALGADWHGECFSCTECHRQFEDGKFFLRGEAQDPVCVRCEEKRLKA